MAKMLSMVFLILITFSGLAIVNPVIAQSSHKIYGFISDANGHGLGGAQIIYNVLDVPVIGIEPNSPQRLHIIKIEN
jgi:hypothetical protein